MIGNRGRVEIDARKIMAKDISVAGITDPNHERYKEAAEVRALIDTDPDVRTIYETARGLEAVGQKALVSARGRLGL